MKMKLAVLSIATYFVVVAATAQGYQNFKEDSLQIKTYIHIQYKDSLATDIKVKKVFCSYCNEKQKAVIAQYAWAKMYKMKNVLANKMANGINKKTLFIRVSKEEFRKLE